MTALFNKSSSAAPVVIADIDEAAGRKVADRWASALAHRTDVTVEATSSMLMRRHSLRAPRPGNEQRGIGDTRQLHTTDIDLESWRRVTAVDLDGVLLIKAEIPGMLSAGGVIVNISSMFGVV